jgi:hypothetical protein
MTALLDKVAGTPVAEAADAAAKPAPVFGEGLIFGALPGAITFGALPQDDDAMCVWDGDAVVCTPAKNDKG